MGICSSRNEKGTAKVERSKSLFLEPGGRKYGWFLSGLMAFGWESSQMGRKEAEGVESGTIHRTRRSRIFEAFDV